MGLTVRAVTVTITGKQEAGGRDCSEGTGVLVQYGDDSPESRGTESESREDCDW